MIDYTKLTKRYYTITEVARLFGVNNSLLRYWEGQFPNIQPVKGRNRARRYTVDQVREIERIHDLLKNRGFTIEGAKRELKKSGGASEKINVLQTLRSVRSRLSGIRDILNDAIDDQEES